MGTDSVLRRLGPPLVALLVLVLVIGAIDASAAPAATAGAAPTPPTDPSAAAMPAPATGPAQGTTAEPAASTTALGAPAEVADPGGRFTPIAPTRVMDTRIGFGGSRLGPAETRVLTVRSVPPLTTVNASAFALNVTVTGPTAASHLTLWGHGVTKPDASTINFAAGLTLANAATVGTSNGQIDVFNNAGAVDVIVDVMGWYSAGVTGNGSLQTGAPVTRIMDTRVGLGGPRFAPGEDRDLVVPWAQPGASTTAVLNVTVTGPDGPGHLTVWPDGSPRPTASSLNFVAGQTVANAVTVGVGTNSRVRIFANKDARVDVIVDLVATFRAGPPVDGGFSPIQPSRIMDTRVGSGGGRLGPREIRRLPVLGSPGMPSAVAAVTVNVTTVLPDAPTHLTVWPTGQAQPNASVLNSGPGRVVPNQVTVGVGPDGTISIYNNAGTVDVIVDLAGWTATAPGADSTPPTVSLTTPLPGGTVDATAAGSLKVTGTVADVGSGIGGVDVLVDGVTAAPASIDQTTAPARFSVELNAGSGGRHRITARARDRAGTTADASADVDIAVPAADATVLASDVRRIDSLTSPLLGFDPATWVLTFGPGDAGGLVPGSVLIGSVTAATPDGFVGRISTVTRQGAQVRVSTSPVYVDRVVRQGRLAAELVDAGAPLDARVPVDQTFATGGGAVRVQGSLDVVGRGGADVRISRSTAWSPPLTSPPVTTADIGFGIEQATDLRIEPVGSPVDVATPTTATVVDHTVDVPVTTTAGGIPVVVHARLTVHTTVTLSGRLAAPAVVQWNDQRALPAGVAGSPPDGLHRTGPAPATPVTGAVDVSATTAVTASVDTWQQPGVSLRDTSVARHQAQAAPDAPIARHHWVDDLTESASGSAFSGFPTSWYQGASSALPSVAGDVFLPPTAVPLDLDQPTTLDVTAAGPVVRSFTGTAGQGITIWTRNVSVLGDRPQVILAAADGTRVGRLSLFAGAVGSTSRMVLPADGMYYLTVSADAGPGSAALQVSTDLIEAAPAVVNDPAGRVVVAPPRGRPVFVAFQATAGTRLTAFHQGGQVHVGLLPPGATAVVGIGPPIDVPADGTYRYVVWTDGESPDTTTLYPSTPEQIGALIVNDASGLVVPAGIPGRQRVVEFTASAGDDLTLTNGADRPWLTDASLVGPDLAMARVTGRLTRFTVPTTGSFRFTLVPEDGRAVPLWLSTPLVDPTPLVVNAPTGHQVSSPSIPGRPLRLSFTAAAGTLHTVTLDVGSGTWPQMQILGPVGDSAVWFDDYGGVSGRPTSGGTVTVDLVGVPGTPTSYTAWLATEILHPPIAPGTTGVPLAFTTPGQRHRISVPLTGGEDVTVTATDSPGGARLPRVFPAQDRQAYPGRELWRAGRGETGALNLDIMLDRYATGSVTLWVTTPRHDPLVTDGVTRALPTTLPGQELILEAPVAANTGVNGSILGLPARAYAATFEPGATTPRSAGWGPAPIAIYSWPSATGGTVRVSASPETSDVMALEVKAWLFR